MRVSNRSYLEVEARRGVVEVFIRDKHRNTSHLVRVPPPTRWERLIGRTWESKVVRAVSKLTAKLPAIIKKEELEEARRSEEELEAERIALKLSTDIGE